MYTTKELADATVRVKGTLDKKATWREAAQKAIRGKGIFNQNDISRRTREVLSELGHRGQIKSRSNRAKRAVAR